jgi:hypothetical protein
VEHLRSGNNLEQSIQRDFPSLPDLGKLHPELLQVPVGVGEGPQAGKIVGSGRVGAIGVGNKAAVELILAAGLICGSGGTLGGVHRERAAGEMLRDDRH